MEECLFFLEKRIADLEKRLLYHEEKEYYKYLIAGKSKKALDMVMFVEQYKEPKERNRPLLWMNFNK
jgi:hypothetical protein